VHAAGFPAASLPMLSGLGTLGASLFMFMVGAELRAPEGSARHRPAYTVMMASPLVRPLYRGPGVDTPVRWPGGFPEARGNWRLAFPGPATAVA
jgi:hypothetical protein